MMGGEPRLGEMLELMAQARRKSQPIGTELIEQAIELLERAREVDSKIARVATMAITILENGPEGMEKMAGEVPR